MQKRIVPLHHDTPKQEARYVLYWMQIHRRAYQNQALNFAIEQANKLGLPLVVYEGLRPDYDQANARIHQFIVEALKRLNTFVSERLRNYNEGRNVAGEHWTSELSPYLHFGHISAMEVALAVLHAEAPADCIDAFLEELNVRRELSYNFCHRHFVVFRQARSRLGAAAAGFRTRALYDIG